ncbi:phosphotransferase [Phenylobacterium sp.]|uniref:phosphotransferase n=1 Tax=Phenylobacterium sp. TaxID=1871053 RepID=UPI00286A79C0|nr:phosphotransferase [Phenylobacterium sp.]
MACPFPAAARPAIDRALMKAFATVDFDSATPISGGLGGAGLWRIRVGGIAYVLRIEGPRDAFRDPARGYACMDIAAGALLAPRVRYACAADGVAIMDLVAPRSLALDYPGDSHGLVVELARAVRLLHQTPAFPPLVDYMDGLDALIGQHQGTDLLHPAATDELFARHGDLRAAYCTLESDRVSSHNDLNPGNVLYDGERLWLIDWESAFLADRYVDLATVANWFARGPAAEDALLTTYFGRAPSKEERARFHLMRQVNHIFYGVMFLNGVAAERPGARLDDRTLAGPSLQALGQRLGTGAFSLSAWEDRVTYGKARLAAALDGLREPAFAEALAALPA